MPDWEDEAKQAASKDPNLVDKGVQEAGQMADDKTGGRYGGEIQDAEKQADQRLGAGQGNQDPQQGGNQDPQQGGNQ
jgi:MT0933-like antitoxin protein